MYLAELLIGHVGVNLRGCHRSVAEQSLNRADVGAVAQKIGGVGMAEGVTTYVLPHNTRLGRVFLNNSLDTSWR